MNERVVRPTEAADCNWNDDGVTYPSTDPGGPKRLTGHKPKDVPVPGPGEVIAANDQNWLHGLEMQMVSWLRDLIPREWTELSEGIAASATRELLRVVPPASGIRSRLVELYSTAAVTTGGANPRSIATDGLRVYYFGGTGNKYIVAVSPVDGEDGAAGGIPLWEINPHGANDVLAVCTDGTYVYYSMNAGPTGLQRVDAVDGTNLTTAGATHSHNKLRANGVNVVGIEGSTGAGDLDIWLRSAMTLVATKVTGSASLRGLALDEDTAYVGGDRNGADDVWAYPLTGGAVSWTAQLDGNAPTIRDICTDGDFIYVATDSFAIVAGGNRSLFCLERVNGTVLWAADLGVNISMLAVDDEYLYAVDIAAKVLYMLRKGPPGESATPLAIKLKSNVTGGSTDTIASDGTSLFFPDGATATNLRRLATAQASKLFMRAAGTDNRRRPIQTLAIPA